VIIPDSVIIIGFSAFEYNNIINIHIGENSLLANIDYRAFGSSTSTNNFNEKIYVNNPNLTTIYNNSGKSFDWNYAITGTSGTSFATNNTTIKNANGNLINIIGITDEACFEFDQTTGTITNYLCYDGNDEGLVPVTDLVIPESINGIAVTTIIQFAFWENNLTSVVIPDSVETIGNSAFAVNNITSIYIGKNSNLTDLGSTSFSSVNTFNNPNLTTIYNNSGKAFDWSDAILGTEGTPFVTGSTIKNANGNLINITTGGDH